MADMDPVKKRWVLIVAAAITIGTAVIISVFPLAFNSAREFPEWHGKEDWEACAAVASVSPEEAVRIAWHKAGFPNTASYRYYAVVTPRYINETGQVFVLTCTGQLKVGAEVYSMYPTSPGPSYAWAVVIGDRHLDGIGPGCEPTPTYVRWTINAILPEHVSCC